MTLSCGCAANPTRLEDYCRTHWTFGCHTNGNQEQGLCPPCRMGPIRLALHLVSRTVYFAGIKGHRRHHSWAMRVWLALWRAERKTWPA